MQHPPVAPARDRRAAPARDRRAAPARDRRVAHARDRDVTAQQSHVDIYRSGAVHTSPCGRNLGR
ncbi:hypothetical protein DVS28_a3384 [Euzebya pacifica]|uniref:Uncharacterized protein n=1 Tax=Euzebya pacifica TaxID=1608957 RepID=A0A346Y0R2_9ACTN|nr:hypothetical protein DVS28_a3384 [Euzebya pacifica]